MHDGLYRLIGMVKAKEKDETIEVVGIPTGRLILDLRTVWGTSKLGNNMFVKMKSGSVEFYKFFAIDVLYMAEEIFRSRYTGTPKRALKRIIEVIQKDTWIKNINEDKGDILDFSRLKNINLKMLDNQMEFLKQYNHSVPRYNLKGFMLAAPPGSGKTLTGLALAECLNADAVIIVSPMRAVHEVWQKTIRSNLIKVPEHWNSVDGLPVPKNCKHFIVHYEYLGKALEMFKKYKFKKPVILLDECHNFNEITAQRTNNFVTLCRMLDCQHVLWASGTPIKAIGNEVIPFLRSIDPLFTPGAEEGFKKIFGKSASKAVDVLRNRLGFVTYKVEKKKVVDIEVNTRDLMVRIPNSDIYTLDYIRKEMIEFITERLKHYRDKMPEFEAFYNKALRIHEGKLKTQTDKEQYNRYRAYVSYIRKGYDASLMKEQAMYCNKYELQVIIPNLPQNMREEFKSCRSVIKYVELKVRGECLGRVLGKKRAQCHVDMIPHVGLPKIIDYSVKKTLIFTSFVEVVKATEEYLTKQGYKPLVVYGDTNKDLNQIVAKYRDDIDANPLIATYQSLSTAVPLTMANTCVLMNQPFRSHEYDQATSRVNRLGQDTPVEIIHALLDTGAQSNISTRSKDIMEWSKEQINAILGIDESDVADNLAMEDLIDQLSDKEKANAFVSSGVWPGSAAW